MSRLYRTIWTVWLLIGLGLCAFVLLATLTPHPPSFDAMPNFDKIEHSVGFMGMGLWFGALFRRQLLYVLLFLSIFGAVTEILQATLTTHRSGDPMDWLADTIGAALGLALVRLMGVDWPYWLWGSVRQRKPLSPGQARNGGWRLW